MAPPASDGFDWPALVDWADEALGLPLGGATLDRLRRYIDHLRLWNRKVALVSQQDLPSLLIKHLADSLVAAAHCATARRIADLGSGAGFPGLVIAALHPASHIALFESRGRKVSFLEDAIRVSGLANATAVHARIEDAAARPAHHAGYDLIVSRALADLPGLIALARPLAAPGATLLAMRAAAEPLSAPAESIPYALPDGTPRQLTRVPLDC